MSSLSATPAQPAPARGPKNFRTPPATDSYVVQVFIDPAFLAAADATRSSSTNVTALPSRRQSVAASAVSGLGGKLGSFRQPPSPADEDSPVDPQAEFGTGALFGAPLILRLQPHHTGEDLVGMLQERPGLDPIGIVEEMSGSVKLQLRAAMGNGTPHWALPALVMEEPLRTQRGAGFQFPFMVTLLLIEDEGPGTRRGHLSSEPARDIAQRSVDVNERREALAAALRAANVDLGPLGQDSDRQSSSRRSSFGNIAPLETNPSARNGGVDATDVTSISGDLESPKATLSPVASHSVEPMGRGGSKMRLKTDVVSDEAPLDMAKLTSDSDSSRPMSGSRGLPPVVGRPSSALKQSSSDPLNKQASLSATEPTNAFVDRRPSSANGAPLPLAPKETTGSNSDGDDAVTTTVTTTQPAALVGIGSDAANRPGSAGLASTGSQFDATGTTDSEVLPSNTGLSAEALARRERRAKREAERKRLIEVEAKRVAVLAEKEQARNAAEDAARQAAADREQERAKARRAELSVEQARRLRIENRATAEHRAKASAQQVFTDRDDNTREEMHRMMSTLKDELRTSTPTQSSPASIQASPVRQPTEQRHQQQQQPGTPDLRSPKRDEAARRVQLTASPLRGQTGLESTQLKMILGALDHTSMVEAEQHETALRQEREAERERVKAGYHTHLMETTIDARVQLKREQRRSAAEKAIEDVKFVKVQADKKAEVKAAAAREQAERYAEFRNRKQQVEDSAMAMAAEEKKMKSFLDRRIAAKRHFEEREREALARRQEVGTSSDDEADEKGAPV